MVVFAADKPSASRRQAPPVQEQPSETGTWCPTACKPLFLRPEAPRLSGRMGLRRQRRGAPLPANPCFFVRKHHVFRVGWAFVGKRPRRFPSSSYKERNSAGREARCCSFIIHMFSKKRKNRRLPNFPGSFPPSIFSAGELNFCVRDGNRCILSAIITGFSLFVF